MSIFGDIKGILARVAKYTLLATAAVNEAEATALPGATKKQIAVAAVLAGAHAGEQVENETVKKVAAYVEFAVGIANTLGLFGAPKPTPVVVPPQE